MSKISSSIKTGSHHWILQRATALALIPLVIWLVFAVLQIVQDPINYLPVFFDYPLNAVAGILFIATSLYHGSLGMQVVLEDYIPSKFKRKFCIMFVHFISIIAAVFGILSILRLHLIG